MNSIASTTISTITPNEKFIQDCRDLVQYSDHNMSFSLLHLNVERSKHIDAVKKLLENRNPDVVCFEEAMFKDVEMFASLFGYEFAFAPLFSLKDDDGSVDDEGPAILSKFPITKIKKSSYHDGLLKNPPVLTLDDFKPIDNQRPKNRYSYHYTLLSVLLKLENDKNITISTTHFPVTDHTTPMHKDHDLQIIENIDDIEHEKILLNKLVDIIRLIPAPLVFTADLNNPRGEYVYDTLAHELVDRVPILESSLDSELHRMKGLKLMVDTIMTTPDVLVDSFEVIEGVSDHKAFLVTFE